VGARATVLEGIAMGRGGRPPVAAARSRRDRAIAVPVLASLLVTLALGPERSEAQDLTEVFRKVRPSVVVIKARGRDVTESGQVRFSETGSGVLVSADGKVMTAAHVVHTMDEITVELLGGETVPAKVIASAPAADLSLVQLAQVPAGARPAVMADSSSVQVGQQIIVVGAPYGLGYSMSVGWIRARWPPNSIYKAMPLAEFFQTDAAINTGNSGGPMFNLAGEVIGIVSHNISKSGGSEGLGFVVTINTAKQLLLEQRSFWSGLEGQLLSDQLADLLNLPPKTIGYLVKTVAKGSPAELTGLRGGTTPATIGGHPIVLGGDIILTVAGIPAGTPGGLARIQERISALPAGAAFSTTILRAGTVMELNARVP
jgi:S1-C subfamily serine protease